jgi:hypothetical protein
MFSKLSVIALVTAVLSDAVMAQRPDTPGTECTVGQFYCGAYLESGGSSKSEHLLNHRCSCHGTFRGVVTNKGHHQTVCCGSLALTMPLPGSASPSTGHTATTAFSSASRRPRSDSTTSARTSRRRLAPPGSARTTSRTAAAPLVPLPSTTAAAPLRAVLDHWRRPAPGFSPEPSVIYLVAI